MGSEEKSGAGPSGATAAGGGPHVVLSHRWLPVVLVLVLAPWALIAWMMVWPSQGKPAQGPGPVAVPPVASEQVPIKGKPGPWGNVEYVPITIARPPEFLQELSPGTINNPWHFPGNTIEQVKAYFQTLPLTDEQRSRLVARLVAVPEIKGCVLTPEPEVVRTLSPEARKRLYRTLAESNLNTDQVNAFRIPQAEFQQRMAALSGLKLDMKFFQSLFYEEQDHKFFADLPLIFPQIPQTDDRVLLLQTLTEQTTFLARLRVKENSNVDDLESYWGRGGRTKDIGPLLQSLSRIPGGQTIDVVHLLPAFARRRIYTFPRPTSAANAMAYDCHWTALNFFSDQPDDRFLDKGIVKETLKSDYYPIYGNPLLGDLVLLVSESNQIIHTAVYVADNFVFTKNGSRYETPWIFMRVEDVKAFYSQGGAVTVSYIRRKDF